MKLPMKSSYKSKSIFILFSTGLALFPNLSAAQDSLRGAPFAYTTETVSMPAAWEKDPVRHEDWAEGADLAVVLDQHLYPVLLPFIQDHAERRDLDISVKEGTCGVSAGMLLRKRVEMAAFCCPAAPFDRLPGLTFHTVGIAPLAIITHPDNPVDNLSEDEVRRIFMGKVTRWSEIGGAEGSSGGRALVRPMARLHCKTRPGHWRLILDNEDLFGHNLDEVGSIPDMLHNVATIPGAVGHVGIWNVWKYRHKWKVKVLSVNGVSPHDSEAVASGRYPFYRPYNVTTWDTEGKGNTLALELAASIMKDASRVKEAFVLVTADRLREKGWRFAGNELVGEPR